MNRIEARLQVTAQRSRSEGFDQSKEGWYLFLCCGRVSVSLELASLVPRNHLTQHLAVLIHTTSHTAPIDHHRLLCCLIDLDNAAPHLISY